MTSIQSPPQSPQPPKRFSEGAFVTGGREIALMVAILAAVAIGMVATYWVRARAEASSKPGVTVEAPTVPTARPAEGPTRGRVVAPAPATPDTDVVHTDIYFDFKSTRLRADAAKMLQDKAATMTHTETWAVLVTGYADSQGPAGYNRVLAQRRADTVKQFLVELGVPESSVKVAALGPEAALCDDQGKECQQLNRRVHLEIRRLGPVAAAPSAAVAAPVSPKADELGQP